MRSLVTSILVVAVCSTACAYRLARSPQRSHVPAIRIPTGSVPPPNSELPRLHFRHFNVEDGLSQGSITSILQDHKGFMWIGTHDGLNRFDGVEFKIYRHHAGAPTSLTSNWITCLFEDSSKILWVGTQGGLNRFDRATESFQHGPELGNDSLVQGEISAIGQRFAGQHPELWIVTESHLVQYNPEKRLSIRVTPGDSDPKRLYGGALSTIANDRGESFWIGGENGFFHFDPATGNAGNIHFLRYNPVKALATGGGKGDHVWFGCLQGLLMLDRATDQLTQFGDNLVVSLHEDRSGQLWVGTQYGLGRISAGGLDTGMVMFRHNQSSSTSLSNDIITSLYQDISGNLWVGTYDGLNILDNSSFPFTTYRHIPDNPNSLGYDFVLPILEDRTGNLWFGTFGGGISVLRQTDQEKSEFIHFRHDAANANSLCSDNVRTLIQDRSGTIWIGTDGGLNLYEPSTGRLTGFPKVPGNDSLQFWLEPLFESRDGTIWGGLSGTLMKIQHDRKGLRLSQPPGIGGGFTISCMYEDASGLLWIGTGGGLLKYDPTTGTRTDFRHASDDPGSISNNNVWSLFEDPLDTSGILWVGTSEGLNRFDKKTGLCTRFLEQEGFPNAWVYGILRDDLGRLWLSTNQGLSVYDDRQPEGRKFKNYTVSDGLPGNEFNRHAFCRLRDGELVFGGTHGVTRFHPTHMRNNPTVPPVVLTRFAKFGKDVAFDRDVADVSLIELNHDEDVFSFEFTALNFTNASRNQYAYMMEGIDRGWIHSGTRRFVSYTHLPPGDYVFRVKAANNDGIWNEQGTSVRVRIHPPFWATWWFIMICCTTLGGGLAIAYRQRIRHLEREKRAEQEFSRQLLGSQEIERSRLAGELHDSLVQHLLVAKNRSLMGLKKSADREAVEREFHEIATAMTQSIGEVRNIAHNLRPYQLDRLGLTKAIQSLVQTLSESSSIRFTHTLDDIDRYFPGERSILFYRIVQEATNNVMKHSHATEASVTVRKNTEGIEMTVADNGKGFEPGINDHHGLGLSGIDQRVRMLNGALSLESSPGAGTRLSIRIPNGDAGHE